MGEPLAWLTLPSSSVQPRRHGHAGSYVFCLQQWLCYQVLTFVVVGSVQGYNPKGMLVIVMPSNQDLLLSRVPIIGTNVRAHAFYP